MPGPVLSGDEHLRAIMDAFPALLLVVDADLTILDMNKAARDYVGEEAGAEGRRLCGEVLRCIHALQEEEGCGATRFCPACATRQSVGSACRGEPVVRRWSIMDLLVNGEARRVNVLVTATPFEFQGHRLALVVLEDVTEITELRRLLPICSGCGKVRSEDQYWQSVHDYLREHTSVEFSHSACPECLARLYGSEALGAGEPPDPPAHP